MNTTRFILQVSVRLFVIELSLLILVKLLAIKLLSLLLQVQFASENGTVSWEGFNKVLTDAVVEKSRVEMGSNPPFNGLGQ